MKIFRVFVIILAGLSLAASSTQSAFTSQVTVSGNQFSTGTWEKPKVARIVVNEVFYEGTHEWIELYNGGDATADIKGWQICDHLSTEHCGSLNPEQKTEIAPGEYVLIAHDAADLAGLIIPDGVDKIYYAGSKIAFNDPGDSVVLKDLAGTIIDMMSYGSDTLAFSSSVHVVIDDSNSLERIEPGLDTDTAADWEEKVPTPGYDGDPVLEPEEILPAALSTEDGSSQPSPEPSPSPTPFVKTGGSSADEGSSDISSPSPTPTPEPSVVPEPSPSPTPADSPTLEISATPSESPSAIPPAE